MDLEALGLAGPNVRGELLFAALERANWRGADEEESAADPDTCTATATPLLVAFRFSKIGSSVSVAEGAFQGTTLTSFVQSRINNTQVQFMNIDKACTNSEVVLF